MTLLVDGVRLAVGTLTVLPVPPPREVGPRVAGLAMVLAPVVVLPVGAAAAGVAWALAESSPLVGAVLAIAVLAVGSGVLHLDGLADTADGLAVQGDAARRLEVMRRGDVGPAGVAALVLVLLVQVAALTELLAARDGRDAAVALLLGVAASRAVLAVGCARGVRPARAQGLGSAVAGSVPPLAAALVLVVMAGAAAATDGAAGVVGVTVAVACLVALLVVVRRRLGGVTGDVLGAGVELALAGYLVALAVG